MDAKYLTYLCQIFIFSMVILAIENVVILHYEQATQAEYVAVLSYMRNLFVIMTMLFGYLWIDACRSLYEREGAEVILGCLITSLIGFALPFDLLRGVA